MLETRECGLVVAWEAAVVEKGPQWCDSCLLVVVSTTIS